MKLVLGLGNPGTEYDATRHNVGWWLLDRVAYDLDFGAFRKEGAGLVTEGRVEDTALVLLKPTTYMNRSGVALRPYLGREGFDVSEDLLVAVDDAAMDVGRVRIRPGGGAGGHNGLRSVQAAVGHDRFPRIRIGVGVPPEGSDLVQWVLSPMEEEEEDRILTLLPELVDAVSVWAREGVEPTMNRFNR